MSKHIFQIIKTYIADYLMIPDTNTDLNRECLYEIIANQEYFSIHLMRMILTNNLILKI